MGQFGLTRMTKFGMVTQVLEKLVSKGSATLPPIPRGRGPSNPKILGPHLCENGLT